MGKCKYYKYCEGFSEDSKTCTEREGFYLRVDKPCGLYWKAKARKEKKKKHKAHPLYLNPITTTRSIEIHFLKLLGWFSSHRISSPSPFRYIRERVVPLIIKVNKKEVSN